MIEYLYDAIRAVAGQDFTVTAKIVDDEGNVVTDGCKFMFYPDNDTIVAIEGTYYTDIQSWQFNIPANVTKGLTGRYFYCIQRDGKNLCFKTPLYLV